MGVVIVFWASVFAILCFAMGTFFKVLTSAVEALLSSLGLIILVLIGYGVVNLIIGSVYETVSEGSWGKLVLNCFLFFVVIGVVGALLGGIGSVLVELVAIFVGFVVEILSTLLDWIADLFEKGYTKSLSVIIDRTNKG
jgi:hypothetical protein